MIVGLLNLYGAAPIRQLVTQALVQSGLLAATDVLYYTQTAPPHPHSAKVQEDRNLFLCAKQYTGAYIWSFNVKNFSKGTAADLDWCAYEVYFLIEQWQRALAAFDAGYESYGVNLHSVPEPHYEGYCFWMSGTAMNSPTLQRPYCAFQSFTNHYTQRFPPEHYRDCDWSQTAPLSSRPLQQRLMQLPPEERTLATLMLLLFYNKDHYEPLAYQQAKRPYVILDGPEVGALAAGAPGIGRIDCVLRETLNPLVAYWHSLGWQADFNACEQVGQEHADIIYTTPERVEQWFPHLAGQGVIVVRGSYSGRQPSEIVGDFTLVAQERGALQLL